MTETVLVTRPRQGVLLAELNRPEKLNAIDDRVLEGLLAAVVEAESDDGVRAMVVSGRGRAFSAGGDLKAFEAMDAAAFRSTVARFMRLSLAIQSLPKPVIAAVHGYAMAGGFELAVMADVRIAAEGTRFGLPDTALGLSPTSGMTWSLPRLIGLGRALHLTLSSGTIDAIEAERIGLVARVVPADVFLEAALDYAAAIAAAPPVGVAMTKRLYHAAATGDLAAATEREIEAELACFEAPETKEQFRRFLRRKTKG